MDNKKTWLVYLISQCEMGTEGWSGWCYYSVAHGDTDEEVYNDWLKNVKSIYGVDLSKNLKCHEGHWSCYYPLAKVELPTTVYGHAGKIKLEACYDKHDD